MLDAKDYISFVVGIVLFVTGLLPLLHKLMTASVPGWFALPWLPVGVVIYLIAGAGFYLAVESVIEITNSNKVGWISFLIGAALMVLGIIKILGPSNFGVIGFDLPLALTPAVYSVIFIIEGAFLMIAMFAMEM